MTLARFSRPPVAGSLILLAADACVQSTGDARSAYAEGR